MFDTYTLKARIYPIILLFFPLILIGFFYSLEWKSFLPFGSSAILSGAFCYLFSQLGRDKGKLKEPLLWQSWGGMPTIQVLRLNNDIIDKYTKKRYHEKLMVLCPVKVLPSEDMEDEHLTEADEIYKTWTKYLISKTRDTKTFDLLFKDNCSYGFRRNLWGLKPFAVVLLVFLLVGNCLWGYYQTKSFNPLLFSKNMQYSFLGLITLLLFWFFIVSKKWVKLPAFSYAERLCETSESL